MKPQPTTYVIDGYNLLHAMGILLGRVGPHGLERARDNLLGVLAGSFGDETARLTVVFDAASARAGGQAKQVRQGITVLYAVQRVAADDLIEDLIADHADPKRLAVVSDDHRLQLAARRRQAQPMSCGAFLDVLEEKRHKPVPDEPTPAVPLKEIPPSQAETHFWLAEFRDLQNELAKPEYSVKPAKLPPKLPAARKKPPRCP